MRTIILTILVFLVSCEQQKVREIVDKKIIEEDSTYIKYPFADLKVVRVHEVKDTIKFDIYFRNLDTTIEYSNPLNKYKAVEYSLVLNSGITDSTRFRITFQTTKPDSNNTTIKSTHFKTYLGKCASLQVLKIFHKSPGDYFQVIGKGSAVKINEQRISINLIAPDFPDEIRRAINNNLNVQVYYNYPDSALGNIYYQDFLQNNDIFDLADRGKLIGPRDDTTVTIINIDMKK